MMENKEKASVLKVWLWAWLVAVVVSGLPVGWLAYKNLIEVNIAARYRFIVDYELWRAHPKLKAAPQQWARSASHLLTDRRLMNRMRIVHPNNAEQIELDYRRDLTIAQGLMLAKRLLPWALALALIYTAGWWLLRPRKPVAPPNIVPASYSDPRYRE
jgi:hypothetical protein